ncbi:DUF2336 domain-containing protein [Roseibium sediminicola]|uniref:DUF2336 domain-containing protein n=1 Tax=Roseibium sediminicola TaxID=2933272 RepID=A0ABT0GUW8_9HYPH|nr:DUF2336 domain-containing protein [Roseibium sp. CAU 1639]MCK7613214.1 DUF2336 domain-containing protein [Roseibium sp. CAU 1639]
MPRSLIKLALEGTDEARRRLFAQVSELVVANLDQRTDRELAIFSEVIIKLYSVGSATDRARLAQKLAAQPSTPVELARQIAKDEVNVAMPVLAHCPVFTQEDLLDFVEHLSNAHLQVLARRTDLSPEVSDVIAERGDRPVHRILAGNREIRLSRDAMLKLVKFATEDPVLREDLCLRTDLSPSACRTLLPLVDDDTKKRLHRIIEGALSQEQLDQIARLKVLRREFGDALENTDMSLLWREAERSEITVNELMILLLQDGRFNHAIELLSARGRTAQKSLKDAVYNGKQDLVLRSAAKAELELSTFALFAKLRCDHLKVPATQGSEWTAAYKKFLESHAVTKQSRCGDFQANRRTKKPRQAGSRGAGLAAI